MHAMAAKHASLELNAGVAVKQHKQKTVDVSLVLEVT